MIHTKIRLVLAAAWVALAAPALAGAATLFTPPLSYQVFFGTDVECKITNAARTPTVVRVRHVSQRGNMGPDSGDVRLQPGQSLELRANGAGRTYCRFDVDGSASRVRASACGVDLGATGCKSVLAAE